MKLKQKLIQIIKRLLPQSLKRLIIRTRERLLLATLWFFSRTRFLSSLYYCFFSRRFAREHQSVLKGRLAFLTDKGMLFDSNTLLRRNIHRIEKGLIMQPRKAMFARDYISDTVAAYGQSCVNPAHDEQELKWARDVLSEYFAAVDADLLPEQVKQRFFDIDNEKVHADSSSIPYHFAHKVRSTVSAEAFLALCTQRRSVRWFEQKPVDRLLLEQAVTMASQAPSACNRQPYQFYIADEKKLGQKLIDTPMGTKGFAHNVPCTIVVTADLAYYPTERDRHLVYIDSTLASMQLLLALETLGLSSCPINWPDIEASEQKMVDLLGLPDTVRPIMLIAVGYGEAQGKIPFSHKKSADQLIRYVE